MTRHLRGKETFNIRVAYACYADGGEDRNARDGARPNWVVKRGCALARVVENF